jgi:hypothetical protein
MMSTLIVSVKGRIKRVPLFRVEDWLPRLDRTGRPAIVRLGRLAPGAGLSRYRERTQGSAPGRDPSLAATL